MDILCWSILLALAEYERKFCNSGSSGIVTHIDIGAFRLYLFEGECSRVKMQIKRRPGESVVTRIDKHIDKYLLVRVGDNDRRGECDRRRSGSTPENKLACQGKVPGPRDADKYQCQYHQKQRSSGLLHIFMVTSMFDLCQGGSCETEWFATHPN